MTSARNPQPENFGGGMGVSLALHAALAAAIVAVALIGGLSRSNWGEHAASTGSIQATMVAAIPLPQKAPPVDKAVLAPEHVSEAPQPVPKEATQPPPRPTDIEVKARTQPTKVAPVPHVQPPPHPQPTAPSPKATTGESATQLPQAVAKVTNGTASLTVPNRVYGDRYGYYFRIVSNKVAQNYETQEVNAAASQNKSVSLVFDIEHDGTIANLRIETKSGSPTLDLAAMHALQRIDTFGPLPAGDHITIEYKFDYHNP
jgi:protein TonB